MADKHLKLKPHSANGGRQWWYEDPSGIWVFVPTGTGTVEVRIPWKSIRAALERKDKK